MTLLLLLFAVLTKAQLLPAYEERLQHTLDSVCQKYQIKGVSAALLVPGVGVWKGTYGESYSGVPVTSDMLMGMGSNTKTHISALLLKLQEDSLINLDDTIGRWIQGYPNISGQIKIRQLLNHTSGIYDYLHNDAVNDSIFGNPSKIWAMEELLQLALAPNFAPGTSWSYSNTNYVIAGIIIREVLQQSPFTALHQRILGPQGLNHTYVYGEQGMTTIAHPWSMNMTGTEMTDMTTTPFLDNLFSMATTAGALMTTAEDNVQFWHQLTSGLILKPESWKQMTTTVSLGNGDGYGLGIFFYSKKMNGRSFYSHGGTFFGYINENMVDTTSGVTISVMTNQDSVNNNGLLATVIRALHKVSLNPPKTGIDENTVGGLNVKLYPNPAADIVHLEMDLVNNDVTGYSIMDMSGKEYLYSSMAATIDVSSLQPGLYMLLLKDNGNRVLHVQKLQIAR
jgi:D-alanyl-D-alanine carboxypeptidase